MEKEKPYRPDLEPGFWPNYQEPNYQEPTAMAKAIQYPLSDPNWQNRVLNAYMKKVKKDE